MRKVKRQSRTLRKPRPTLRESQPGQVQTVEELTRELNEALQQQTATSQILRLIARSPTELQPVLDAVAESAARVCGATDARILRVEGNVLRVMAHFGPMARALETTEVFDRGTLAGRAVLDRQTIHVHDLQAAEAEFPRAKTRGIALGIRTALAAPLLREGVPIGVIHIRRTEIKPFTDEEIKLLEAFADQAVIAIENVRLFNETKEALDQQTATSEVLKVISRSAFDLTPVFQAVVQNAVDLCGADNASILRREGEVFRYVANAGNFPEEASFMSYWGTVPLRPGRGSLTGRVALERRSVQIDDIDTDPEYEREFAAHKLPGSKTHLGVPLLKDGEPIGLIIARRFAVQPFTDKQIKLLETFADQAVIAIENVRLFQGLTEALEQQTATGEVLRVIASSPTELQPVLDTLLANAVKLSGATKGHIRQLDGELLRYVSHYNESPELVDALNELPQRSRPE
ncbi:MAG: GAF domain-containing protein, partial [Candidatus Binatia bacterium]